MESVLLYKRRANSDSSGSRAKGWSQKRTEQIDNVRAGSVSTIRRVVSQIYTVEKSKRNVKVVIAASSIDEAKKNGRG